MLLDSSNINELISNIETPAFGFEKKLIVARNTGLFKKDENNLRDKINEYIKENYKFIDENTTLLFIEEDVDSRLALCKTLKKYGEVTKFDFLKPVQICSELKSIAKAYGVEVENTTLMYFIECCRN